MAVMLSPGGSRSAVVQFYPVAAFKYQFMPSVPAMMVGWLSFSINTALLISIFSYPEAEPAFSSSAGPSCALASIGKYHRHRYRLTVRRIIPGVHAIEVSGKTMHAL